MESMEAGAITAATPPARELAARENEGLQVRLLWHPDRNELAVAVGDVRAGDRFQLAVVPERALDVFHHPFAYTVLALVLR